MNIQITAINWEAFCFLGFTDIRGTIYSPFQTILNKITPSPPNPTYVYQTNQSWHEGGVLFSCLSFELSDWGLTKFILKLMQINHGPLKIFQLTLLLLLLFTLLLLVVFKQSAHSELNYSGNEIAYSPVALRAGQGPKWKRVFFPLRYWHDEEGGADSLPFWVGME